MEKINKVNKILLQMSKCTCLLSQILPRSESNPIPVRVVPSFSLTSVGNLITEALITGLDHRNTEQGFAYRQLVANGLSLSLTDI